MRFGAFSNVPIVKQLHYAKFFPQPPSTFVERPKTCGPSFDRDLARKTREQGMQRESEVNRKSSSVTANWPHPRAATESEKTGLLYQFFCKF